MQIMKSEFLGALYGDINGSIYEFRNIRTKDFELFTNNMYLTDDSVLTIEVMRSLLECQPIECTREWESKYRKSLIRNFKNAVRSPVNSHAGFGGRFYRWAWSDDTKPYGSYGNGSAMRVSPVAFVSKTVEQARWLAKVTSEVTHNHPEGVKGAVATAEATYMALHGSSIIDIFQEMLKYYPSIATMKYDELREHNQFNETCQGTVGESIYLFLQSTSLEDCIRSCVSVGGDCDTIGAIGCAIAAAYYKDDSITQESINKYLTEDQKMVIEQFRCLPKCIVVA